MKTKMFQRIFFIIVLLALAGLWIPKLAFAVWPGDPTVNVPICTAPCNQNYPTIVSDGSGGAIITWMDNRGCNNDHDIYMQRVNADGEILWTQDGVAICTVSGEQLYPTIVSDGSGGAIITWMDGRSGNLDIYAQRVDASGVVQWQGSGVAICTASDWQHYPQIVSDGSGGAIITWQDNRSGGWPNSDDIYAQRVFSDSSLPVTLSSFTATASDGKVTLRWRAESEVNNLGFAIYRGISQDGPFEKIGWVKSVGNSARHDYYFIDETAQEGYNYFYYIEDVDIRGMRKKSKIIEAMFPEKQSIAILLKTTLLQNYPNPFNPETWIPFQLASQQEVTVRIFDLHGRLVRQLMLGKLPAGVYLQRTKAAYWDGRSNVGEPVASGIYFYQLSAGEYSQVKRMLVVK